MASNRKVVEGATKNIIGNAKGEAKDVTGNAKGEAKEVTGNVQKLCLWAGLVPPSWSDKLQVVKKGNEFQVQVDLEHYRGNRGTCQHWLAALRNLALAKGWDTEFEREAGRAFLAIRWPTPPPKSGEKA